MSANGKPKLAMYWAAACGGCEVSVLNIHEHILEVAEVFDLAFFPCIADFKTSDVEGYPDEHIDVCLFNGAIRNSENEEMARLLRKKSKVMVAFGSCAYEGCIPALSNLTSSEATLNKVYNDNPSIENPDSVRPQTTITVPEGELSLPSFYHTVRSLDQVVDVDYTIPGCPPESHQIWAVLQVVAAALTDQGDLPPHGSILGAEDLAVCAECPLEKDVKHIKHIKRPQDVVPEPGICLLEQGLLCLGPATRGGCGALCPNVGMGCRGCYGPVPGVIDQGASMAVALASVMEPESSQPDGRHSAEEVRKIVDEVVDPAGTFYRFSMAHSILRRVRTSENGKENGEVQ